jgi:uncharacterized protein (DUF302 family)
MSSGISSALVVERVTFSSSHGFDDVRERIYQGISRPDFAALMADLAAAADYDRYQALVHEAAGPTGLIRFMELDQGHALAADPGTQAFRIVRIIAGNPLTMTRMVRHIPDAGSYVPVTILLYESPDGVRACYDTITSALRPYGDERALKVAEDLDTNVLTLLQNAT